MIRDAQIERFDVARQRLAEARAVVVDAVHDHDDAEREFHAAASALAERCRLAPAAPSPQLALSAIDPDLDARPWSRVTPTRRTR